jgi:hypothetical protein
MHNSLRYCVDNVTNSYFLNIHLRISFTSFTIFFCHFIQIFFFFLSHTERFFCEKLILIRFLAIFLIWAATYRRVKE